MQVDRDYVKAQRALVEQARRSGDQQQVATVLHDLGKYFEDCGMYPLASNMLSEAVQILKQLHPDDDRTRQAVVSLACVEARRGNYTLAENLYNDWLSFRCHELGWRHQHDMEDGSDRANMATIYFVRNKCVILF
jgi:hypothetical protein